MDTIKWIILGIVVVILIIAGIFIYRKKKQYDYVLKMMKASKEQEKIKQQEAAFSQKQLEKSQGEASQIIVALGGAANIKKIEQCAIRIRIYPEDETKINQKALKQAGVSGVIKTKQNIQLVVGDRASQIATAIQKAIGE
jgi:PTS system, glucose-like IIB component